MAERAGFCWCWPCSAVARENESEAPPRPEVDSDVAEKLQKPVMRFQAQRLHVPMW